MNPKYSILIACMALAARSDSGSSMIFKGFNGFDNSGSILSPFTLELGYGFSGSHFEIECLTGFGYREKTLAADERNYAEKTRLIPIEGNILVGRFGERDDTPYFGLGYHYLFYKYDTFGETFTSNGYLIPLIFGYQTKILKKHSLGVSIEKPILSDLAFDQISFSGGPPSYSSPYEPVAGLEDIEIRMIYKLAFR